MNAPNKPAGHPPQANHQHPPRICKRCGASKPLADFARGRNATIRVVCRACISAQSAEYHRSEAGQEVAARRRQKQVMLKAEAPALTADLLREKLHYDPDTGVFTRRSGSGRWAAGTVSGSFDESIGYVRIFVDGRYYLAHRLAWLYTYGKWPADQIDHINWNGRDNRICNLREATNAQNAQNRGPRVDTPHGCKGLYWNKRLGKWIACAQVNGKIKHLGVFAEKDDAISARINAENVYYPFLVRKGQHA